MQFYSDGNPSGANQSVGKFSYNYPIMSLARIGFLNNQAIASAEIYLRPLSQPEIVAAMDRSKTYPINPSCPYLEP